MNTSDMHRVFVVERALGEDQATLRWVSVGSYSTEFEAINHAREVKAAPDTKGVRVRQFWVTADITPAHAKFRAQFAPVDDNTLTTFTCQYHPKVLARSFIGGTEPRCTECKTVMVPVSFANSPVVDLADLPPTKDPTK